MVESRASRRRSAGNHLETASQTKIRTRLNLPGRQQENWKGKGRVCGFRPFPPGTAETGGNGGNHFCLREFHPANRAPRPPLSLSSLAILLLRGGGAISSTPRAEWNCQPCFSGGHHRAVPIGHGPRPAIDPRGTREALVHRPRRIRPSFRQGLYFMCVCVYVCMFFIPVT